MKYNCKQFETSYDDLWDSTINSSSMGNFLLTRKFLSYHQNKFKDMSLIIMDENDKICGLFPAAIAPNDDKKIISHPGTTYGGLIYMGRRGADEVSDMLDAVRSWYLANNFSTLLYKTVPTHLHTQPSSLDQYALWRSDAPIIRRDLWNIIPLDKTRTLSKGRKWSVNKAKNNKDIVIKLDNSDNAYTAFYTMLTECLSERHETKPVHTLEDMFILRDKFPDAINLWIAYDSTGKQLAGSWVFNIKNNHAWHTQYIASNSIGRELFAVDLLIETIIEAAQQQQNKYLSFGASTEDNGRLLNAGLFNFKAGFGFGSTTQDFYNISL